VRNRTDLRRRALHAAATSQLRIPFLTPSQTRSLKELARLATRHVSREASRRALHAANGSESLPPSQSLRNIPSSSSQQVAEFDVRCPDVLQGDQRPYVVATSTISTAGPELSEFESQTGVARPRSSGRRFCVTTDASSSPQSDAGYAQPPREAVPAAPESGAAGRQASAERRVTPRARSAWAMLGFFTRWKLSSDWRWRKACRRPSVTYHGTCSRAC